MSPDLQSRGKWIIAALMIATLVLMLTFLQQQFDQGDYRRAIELVSSKPPGAQWSVNQELELRAGRNRYECEPKLLSTLKGTLEVTCLTGEPEPYKFHVDVVARTVNAADARTQSLIDVAKQKAEAMAAAATDAGA